MPTPKKKAEPKMAGEMHFPFRDPRPGTRFHTFLTLVGYPIGESPEAKAKAQLDLFADLVQIDEPARLRAAGYDPTDPVLARVIEGTVAFRVEVKARRLEAQLMLPRGRGAPSNDPQLESFALAIVRYEKQAAEKAGLSFSISELARDMGVDPDALRRASKRAGKGYLAKAGPVGSAGYDDVALIVGHSQRMVARHWPKTRGLKSVI